MQNVEDGVDTGLRFPDPEHEGTVPDLRTERSRVVESGLSPAKRNAASFAAEFGCGEWGRLAGLWHRNEIETKGF